MMGTANKNKSRKAVKEHSSGAAGQPWTSFGLLGTAQCAALVSADAMQYGVSRFLPDPYRCSHAAPGP